MAAAAVITTITIITTAEGQIPLTRNYESNGPDVKIRGSAQQIAEKYATLARDAHSSGDRVMAENYLQHAEHYNRIIAAAQAQFAIAANPDAVATIWTMISTSAGYGFEGGVNGGGDAHRPRSHIDQPQPETAPARNPSSRACPPKSR